jgi:hypothetical protein
MQKPHWTPTLEDKRVGDDPTRALGESFERPDVVVGHLLRLAQARKGRLAVNVDKAAAARAFRRASVLTRRDAALLAQHLEQMHAGLVMGFDVFSVQVELNVRHP